MYSLIDLLFKVSEFISDFVLLKYERFDIKVLEFLFAFGVFLNLEIERFSRSDLADL